MIVVSAFSTILVLLYSLVVLRFYRALCAVGVPPAASRETPFVSVLIPFRNESAHLPALLQSLNLQEYPPDRWEAVFVNDHSTDEGAKTIARFFKESRFYGQLLELSEGKAGKKAALKMATEAAQGQLLLQTDADCRMAPGWLGSMVSVHSKSARLVIGPVAMEAGGGFWARFAVLDFLALQASGAAMAILGKPIMGSAANLLYPKDLAQATSAGSQRASGDDVFLIQAAAKEGRVGINLDPAALVKTKAPRGFRELIKQRARWGGKTTSYASVPARLLALLVGAVAAVQVFLLILAFWFPVLWAVSSGLWLIKGIADFLLLKKCAVMLKQKSLLPWFLPASLVYPFYILITALVIVLFPVGWKGRALRPLSD